jgi:hypothetical protein
MCLEEIPESTAIVQYNYFKILKGLVEYAFYPFGKIRCVIIIRNNY